MGLSLVTAPSVEPVSVAEAKVHCRVDGGDHDTFISAAITAARQHVEDITRRALVTQTWDYTLSGFPSGDIELPIQPVQSVTYVNYTASDGSSSTFTYGTSPDVAKWELITDGPRARVLHKYGLSWPSTRSHGNAVTVRFVAGYSPSTDSPQDLTANVPAPLKHAIKLYVAELLENREVNTQLRMQELPVAMTLISPYILRGF